MKAFTLIECLLYFTLLSILLTNVVACFYAIGESMHRSETISLLIDDGHNLLEEIRIQMANATRVELHEDGSVVDIYEHDKKVSYYRLGEYIVRDDVKGIENVTSDTIKAIGFEGTAEGKLLRVSLTLLSHVQGRKIEKKFTNYYALP